MTCLPPEQFVDLLERGGLDAAHDDERAHLAACAECRAAWSEIAVADDVLRAAPRMRDVRPRPIVYVAAAAVVLLSIAALIVVLPDRRQPAQEKPEPTTPELITMFLEGNDAARAKISARGAAAMLPLVEARARNRDAKRFPELLDLIYEIKKAQATTDQARAQFQLMEESRVTFALKDADVLSIFDLLARLGQASLFIDPEVQGKADVALSNEPLWKVLESVAPQCGFDYDVRYGVVFISSPERLWTAPPPVPARPLTPEELKAAREWVAKLKSESLEERDRASADLRKLGRGASPILEEGARSPDPETATRCRALLDEFTPRPPGLLPAANQWRSQVLKDPEKAIAEQLRTAKCTYSLKDAHLASTFKLTARIGGAEVDIQAPVAGCRATLSISDLPAGYALELLTLPFGLDARLEDGKIVVFERSK